MAVAIVPGLFVSVIGIGRYKPIEDVRQIFAEPWLEFDGSQCAGAADVEEMQQAAVDSRFANDFRDVGGDIMDVAMAFGV